jgi:RNA polymerase sigma-70 factor (ECF subfamily)
MPSTMEKIVPRPTPGESGLAKLDFDTLYETMVEYVWNAVCRMGVHGADAEDLVQEIFVIVYRRLGEFEGRAQVKTWVFRIMVHVVQHYFRTHARRPGDRATEKGTEIQALVAAHEKGPAGELERREALRVLDRLLGELEEGKRLVFVLAEVEQLTLAEMAEVVEANANTVASRLRAARRDFDQALLRFRTRELGRMP